MDFAWMIELIVVAYVYTAYGHSVYLLHRTQDTLSINGIKGDRAGNVKGLRF